MDLNTAIKGLLDAQVKLRSHQGTSNPMYMSEQMARLAQFTGAVEEHLATYEKDHEENLARLHRKYLLEEKLSTTAAERLVRTELADEKGKILYLSRIVASAWRQVGVIQSRYNHLSKGEAGQI